jgi:hypothetical protein
MFNKNSLPKASQKWIRDLTKIATKGVISPRLFEAITEITVALKAQNWELAYQLTAVKSYICGVINPKDKKNAFQEDQDANKKMFKASVYVILDCMHHDIAFAMDELPSGTMVLSGNGQVQKMKSKGIHPIVRRIQYEHRAIQKKAEGSRKERELAMSLGCTIEELRTNSYRKINWRKAS